MACVRQEGLTRLLETIEPEFNPDRVERALAAAWDMLDGGSDNGMTAHKIQGRVFGMKWQPPILSFEIERHGAIVVGGSGYAEVQLWEVDVSRATAKLVATRKRRIHPAQPRLDTDALAEELATLILTGKTDERLRWSNDRVQIRMAAALPEGSKQTTNGRRKRLKNALVVRLGEHGWQWEPGGWWSGQRKGDR